MNRASATATPCMPEEIILAAVFSSPVRTRAIQYDLAAPGPFANLKSVTYHDM
jgi:hypothetical protein